MLVLRKQWEEGKPDFISVARLLSELTVESLRELIATDAEAAARVGKSVEVAYYIHYFPELEPYREAIRAQLESAIPQTALKNVNAIQQSLDLFSTKSPGQSQNYFLTRAEVEG